MAPRCVVSATLVVAALVGGCDAIPRPQAPGEGQEPILPEVEPLEIPELCLPEWDAEAFEMRDSCSPSMPSVQNSG